MSYERDNIAKLQPYAPGEQPQSDKVIKLNTNEHPDPPCEAVLNALRQFDPELLRRYPSPTAKPFRKLAAQVHKVASPQIIATNGGDELLRLLITVFTQPGGKGIGVSDPTYSLYEVLAAIHDVPVVGIARNQDWSLPDDYAQQLNAAGVNLAMIVNPHAPTGRLESVQTLRRIAQEFNGVLLIDEAYTNFATHDCLELVREGSGLDNVILLRTLSKGYSLAGLRFGYGIASSPDLIVAMDKARDSYNTDVVSQVLACAALSSHQAVVSSGQKIIDQRTRMTQELTQRNWKVLPSQSNFILAQPP
ncbi:MAG: aminotransferase class I/II-fold pyridoxal phosphate-dependent enzyme, partial [Phycisphaeraceae bacterium]|nr:aminotransferase class I/II-fold pyridoxal phosphate-dependent enzyme [Phycisphaeraceae bacterium]